jgi:hypothetical protein
MSQKPEIQRTVPENPFRPRGFDEEAVQNFQLSNAKGKPTEVEFLDGKLRLVYRS